MLLLCLIRIVLYWKGWIRIIGNTIVLGRAVRKMIVSNVAPAFAEIFI